MCDILDIPGYLVTMNIEKAFDLLDHDFLLSVLKKFGFGGNFIYWIKILINHQLDKNINKLSTITCYKWGIYNSYFNLKKGARQGDPILSHTCLHLL